MYGRLTHYPGCWASSGYSVQGCAQLEQKLRLCMDAPVCLPPDHLDAVVLTPRSETQTRRRTTSTTTCRGCTPKLLGLTSETRLSCLLSRNCTPCIPYSGRTTLHAFMELCHFRTIREVLLFARTCKYMPLERAGCLCFQSNNIEHYTSGSPHLTTRL